MSKLIRPRTGIIEVKKNPIITGLNFPIDPRILLFAGTPQGTVGQTRRPQGVYPTGAGTPSFLPSDIGSLVHWYRLNIGITDPGGPGTFTWEDQEGTADLSQATELSHPTEGTGGIVEFAGTGQFLDVAFTASPPWTVLIRIRVNVFASAYFVDGITLDSGVIYMTGTGTDVEVFKGASGFGPVNPVVSTWVNLMMEVNGASSSLALNNGTPATGTLDAGAIGGLTIGADGDGNQPGNFDAAEVCLFNTASLTAGNKSDLQTYMAGLI